MIESTLVFSLLAVPFSASALLSFTAGLSETNVRRIARISSILFGISFLVLLVWWMRLHCQPFEVEGPILYRNGEYHFLLLFYVDIVSIVFLGLNALLGSLVVGFSRHYLHRDPGYQRFFACFFLLVFGMTLLSLSGNLDILFAGWEFVGISSFLLIAFYRHHRNPVRGALKVYSVYRLCDIGLLLGALATHSLMTSEHHFALLARPETLAHLAQVDPWILASATALIVLAACGKSAQYPFTFWLTYAMEGPTPSSAIFYGALSIHAGVFLLIRTYPFWHASAYGAPLVGTIGVITSLIASSIGRTQSNIKGQIAYASAAQVGLQFLELSLGFPTLALIHLVGNACLRCFQLLVSPSIVAYLLRLQGSVSSQLKTSGWSLERWLPVRLRTTLYVFALQEGYSERWFRNFLWAPLSSIGRFLGSHIAWVWILLAFLLGTMGLDAWMVGNYPVIFTDSLGATAVIACALLAFAEERSALRALSLTALCSSIAALSVWLTDFQLAKDIVIHLTGVGIAWFLGVLALRVLSEEKNSLSLKAFLGKAQIHPSASLLLLLSFLGISGFPITPAFIGEDLLMHHTIQAHGVLAVAIVGAFILNGITLARLFARVCWGGTVNRNVPYSVI